MDIEALGDSHEDHAHTDVFDEHDHGAYDPHIWTDPNNAIIMVENILEALIKVDPENEAFYTSNAETYIGELKKLDQVLEKELNALDNRTIIYGGHFAFGYFAKRYGLDYVSPYSGFSPDSEPLGQAVGELINQMNTLKTKAVFFEELIDPKVARIIAEETGAELYLLHGAHNVSKDELQKGVTYITIMNENLERLKAGLKGE